MTEDMGHSFINWKTGAPLTSTNWFGGPYKLVDNYVEVADGAIYDVAVYPEPEDAPVPVGDTIVIDGVTYIRKSQD